MTMEALATENELYRAAFDSFAEERRREPEWVGKIRREAFARFAELGFPSVKDEDWKYTSVAPIARTAFALANGGSTSPPGPLPEGEGVQIVFVNGRHSPRLSRMPPSEKVQVWSLSEVLRKHPAWVEPHLSKLAGYAKSAFTAWNTAFLDDGAFVNIPQGAVLPDPIHLVFLSEAPGDATVSHPRTLILAGPRSQATVVETYIGDANVYFTNAVTEIVLAEGAVLEHYKVQKEGLSGFHVQTLQVRQERASQFTSHNLALGAALARTDLNVLFAGEGGECTLNGLFAGAGSQHLDNHTLIDHAMPHCMSRELYKGILDGKSRGVFHGKIIVRPDAQKTDAMQTNKNLLLSKEALVNSTPALEIRADDVKCRHGSTIGQLDQEALFYLRSRGIGEEDARALLTYAFAADVAGRIKVRAIREGVEAFLGLRLKASAGAA